MKNPVLLSGTIIVGQKMLRNKCYVPCVFAFKTRFSTTHWVIADWLGLMKPARGESCPSRQRRGPVAPGEDRVSSPDQKSFHISTTPTNRGRKWRSPRSIPPRTVWKPQPHRLVADWLGFMEPASGESCPSGQRRGPAAPEEDKVPSPDEKFFHISTTPTNRGRKTVIRRVDTAPRGVETPIPSAGC